MARPAGGLSDHPSAPNHGEQELESMYDYLAKVILLGPSGSGKSCLLHRLIKNEWRILTSQTIGVEFSSVILKVGTGAHRKRMKLQLWDTAGTERFRSVSRSYYRGAAGAILIYDISSRRSFEGLATFLNDARALASPDLALILAGNKSDVDQRSPRRDSTQISPVVPDSSVHQDPDAQASQNRTVSDAAERAISTGEAASWASRNDIAMNVEVSALTGKGVSDVFTRLASLILTKIELGEIDPSDPRSGIQYGDTISWTPGSASSALGLGSDSSQSSRRRRRGTGGDASTGLVGQWVPEINGARRRSGGCC